MTSYHDYEGAEYEYPPHEEEPMTNEEWLKQCTTEQLAGWLIEVTEYCFDCGLNINNNVLCPFGKCIDKECDALDWLKEKHHE